MSKTRLIISQPGQSSRSIELEERTISIGRRPDNTLCLEGDSNVSKYHAVIENRDGEFWVVDLGSSNGTTVNAQRVPDRRKLKNCDVIGIGGFSTIEFQLAESQQNRNSASGSGYSAPNLSMPYVPSVPSTPSVPSVNVPQIPSANINLPQTPSLDIGLSRPPVPSLPSVPSVSTPSASTILGMRTPTLIIGAILLVAVVGGVLYATGMIGGKKTDPEIANIVKPTPEPEASPVVAGNEQPDGPGNAQTPGTQQPDTPTGPTGDSALPPAAVAALGQTLAVQISQKSGYNFDPAFASLIGRYLNEYKNSGDYISRAGKYRDSVDREFVNAQGIQPPLIGYVIAMSQSKFVEKPGSGVWGLPPTVIKDYAVGSAPPNMSDPAASTKVAASYIRSLLDLFEKDNFMYAVACYGMSLDQAGKVKTDLEKKDPGGQDRFDFWKMKNAGVIQGDQVERVARFFAAGIVCENPKQFGLNTKQLSTLD